MVRFNNALAALIALSGAANVLGSGLRVSANKKGKNGLS